MSVKNSFQLNRYFLRLVLLASPFFIWFIWWAMSIASEQCFNLRVFVYNPLIDTDLPSGFAQGHWYSDFAKIKTGMHKNEVLNFIPPPLHSINENTWVYGKDGDSPVGNYAWFQFRIKYNKNGHVITKEIQMFRNRFYMPGRCSKSLRDQANNRFKL